MKKLVGNCPSRDELERAKETESKLSHRVKEVELELENSMLCAEVGR